MLGGVDVSTKGAWCLALLVDDPFPCWVHGGGVWRYANTCPSRGRLRRGISLIQLNKWELRS